MYIHVIMTLLITAVLVVRTEYLYSVCIYMYIDTCGLVYSVCIHVDLCTSSICIIVTFNSCGVFLR